ncbi:ORF12 [Halorubrum pleomorphic virus 11]|uniref:ORF12 n=2 Tax=Betapleolipovirus TaxID=1911605 RepID=A0A410N6R6_9VIRU|nr:ORF12 [Halorubrum pleomorphic virus 12]YP_009819978.1 ORF12 [Halorubrum pleomorphic virus 11]QAS68820.1 ORF12 [Halorubrum pleomorphic virus 12]QAS68916.1 ORF12 [Halorubrum pleomorphic virus 11]
MRVDMPQNGHTKRYNPADIDMANHETEKISMTVTVNSKKWLAETYPDAQSTQEAIRMAISDARQHHIGIRSIREDEDGRLVIDDD